jgi:hypothetical protein
MARCCAVISGEGIYGTLTLHQVNRQKNFSFPLIQSYLILGSRRSKNYN